MVRFVVTYVGQPWHGCRRHRGWVAGVGQRLHTHDSRFLCISKGCNKWSLPAIHYGQWGGGASGVVRFVCGALRKGGGALRGGCVVCWASRGVAARCGVYNLGAGATPGWCQGLAFSGCRLVFKTAGVPCRGDYMAAGTGCWAACLGVADHTGE